MLCINLIFLFQFLSFRTFIITIPGAPAISAVISHCTKAWRPYPLYHIPSHPIFLHIIKTSTFTVNGLFVIVVTVHPLGRESCQVSRDYLGVCFGVMFPFVSLCVAYRSPLCFCAQEVIEFMFASRYSYFAFSLSLSLFSVSSEVGKLAGRSGSGVCI
ncbi:uncharacterized protein BO87DRAFT_20487 [Aspergillus neoniger CBS 115656]|uniref:Uncharacterized protein n=1 Tax=Aspergillus neoniger (strain CBS 115656) TaxID=1448310 RepID=A0A318YP52_ASPNB|nr:hypothetical protein BO87DRAFT_20487 [Aspergillus neoniger CBS 115656]PYH35637.1 hypothetical protein BO87DRAFT_20487 [Aspergillus neoniger CBS 115656]